MVDDGTLDGARTRVRNLELMAVDSLTEVMSTGPSEGVGLVAATDAFKASSAGGAGAVDEAGAKGTATEDDANELGGRGRRI